MRLTEYLNEKSMTLTAFAKVVGTYPQTIHKYVNGQRTPCADMMQRIAHATNGAVQPNDFFDIPDQSNTSNTG